MTVARYAISNIPTRYGDWKVSVYRENAPGAEAREHIAIVRGEVFGEDVLVRVHSECWTGEVLGSTKCDCAHQLDHALERVAAAGRGVIVYLRQEGRGIGLGNKIRAYALQEEGHDTVEANVALGFAPDLRRYEPAAQILGDLGVKSVVLMTNNPQKIEALEAGGIHVAGRESHWVPSSERADDYLKAKIAKMGHLEADTKGARRKKP